MNNCPYCQSSETVKQFERRPDQTVYLCQDCNKHSVRKDSTGQMYPTENPANPNAAPHIGKPRV